MCGRYWIDEDHAILTQVIDVLRRRDPQVKTSGEIFPGDRAPVLCKSRAGNLRPFAMEWGYTLDDGRRIINARMETAAQKPMFRDGMANRRCLLPMSAYFEWESLPTGKHRRKIAPEKRGEYCLGGIYRFENDGPRFAVLTMEAASEIAFIHPRMPLILPWHCAQAWLGGDPCELQLKMKFE